MPSKRGIVLSQPVLRLTAAMNHTPARDSLSPAGVFCLRHRTAADPARQNHQRQLLLADACCIGAGNPQPGCPHGVYNPERSGPAADQLWPGQAEVPQLSASSFPAGSVPLRGCGIQHHHRRCAAISPGLCGPDG